MTLNGLRYLSREIRFIKHISSRAWPSLLVVISGCACPGAQEFNNLDGNRVNEIKAMLQKMDDKELDKFIQDINMAKNILPKQIILKFKSGTAESKVQETLKTLNASKTYEFKSSSALLINVPTAVTRQDVFAIITALNEVKAVDYAVPNAILKIKALPNDPEFPKQDGLRNTGQTGGVAGADIGVEKAWDITKGSRGVRVAVTDTGADYLHPDLASNIWKNPGELGIDSQGREKSQNGLDDDNNGYLDDFQGWDFVNNDNDPMDDHGHGTHVSGTIGAVGNNGIGISGISWQVGIVPLKFIGADGSGDEAAAIKAIDYAASMNIPIINASWGGFGYNQALKDAIDAAGKKGVLFVSAAGNWGYDNDVIHNSPSNYDLPNIIAVAATDKFDQKSSFSNYGAQKVHIAAPGSNILSLGLSDFGRDAPLLALDGTSMATPHVAGAAALIKAAFPQATVAEIKNRLLYGADALKTLLEPNLPQDFYRPDRWPIDNPLVQGGRRLNIFRSLENDATPPGSVSNLKIDFSGVSGVEVIFNAAGDDGASGQAAAYVAVVSNEPVTDVGDWNGRKTFDLTHVNTAIPGRTRAEVRGLELGQKGYITIRAIDNVGNMGPLSSSLAFETSKATVQVLSSGDTYDGINSKDLFGYTQPWLQEEISGRGKVWTDSPGGPRIWADNYMEFTQPFVAPHPDVIFQFDTKLDCDPFYDRAFIDFRLNEATDPLSSYTVWNPDKNAYDWFQSPLWRQVAIYTAPKCEWKTVSFPLRNKLKTGDKIRFRFWFRTYGIINKDRDGMLLDDIKLLYPATPEKPINFIASRKDDQSPYTLTWKDLSSGETRFELAKVSSSAEPVLFAETGANVAMLEPGLMTVDQNLRVRACNGPICSEYSDPIQVALPPPTITSVSPSSGQVAGGNTLSITGSGFLSDSIVRIEGDECIKITPPSSTSITCKSPAKNAGVYSVGVTNPDGQKAILSKVFTVLPPPVISSISPTGGPLAGGNTLTINGNNFVAGALARIQGINCPNTRLLSSNQMTCQPAARTAGVYNVAVINPDQQRGGLSAAYTYRAAPTVSSVSPTKLRIKGGDLLTVNGTGILSGAKIMIGQSTCTNVVVASATSATCTSSALAAGSNFVIVTNTDGQSSSAGSPSTIAALSPSWVATNGGSCSSVCSGVGLMSRLSPEGSYCVSGEHIPASAAGKIPFRYGCWPFKDCRAQGTRSGIQVGQYCYGANQKRDKSKPDITVGCYCDL